MSLVFADTFFWIALTNLEDAAHERAKAFIVSVGRVGSSPLSKCSRSI